MFLYLPIQNSIATRTSGQWHSSPQMVTVKYQEKNGSQQIKNAPITTPKVTNAWRKVYIQFRPNRFQFHDEQLNLPHEVYILENLS